MKEFSTKSRTMVPALSLVSCATGPASVQVTAQAAGSTYFSLGAPTLYKAGSGLELMGRVGRHSRTISLPPREVRIEHLSASGALLDFTLAQLGPGRQRPSPVAGQFRHHHDLPDQTDQYRPDRHLWHLRSCLDALRLASRPRNAKSRAGRYSGIDCSRVPSPAREPCRCI